MQVNQILPSLTENDAVSNDAIEIQKFLVSQGFESNIFVKHVHPNVSKYTKNLSTYHGSGENVLIYHFALAGQDVTDFVKNLPDKKILRYHNITPHHFFEVYDKENLRHFCSKGIDELQELSHYCKIGLGDSDFNSKCLEENGFNNVKTIPIFFNLNISDLGYENNDLKYDNNTINIIFVGRVAPNKKQEDIIRVFYYYHTHINTNSRLFIVGNHQFPDYVQYLKQVAENLHISNSVIFTGMVSNELLRDYYRKSHIFLCMSEHEGFCVPLLEAMKFGLPVLAYNSTGIPYTMGDSGILINKKDFIEIAELINVIAEDEKVRNRIIAKQHERLKEFDIKVTSSKLMQVIESLISSTY